MNEATKHYRIILTYCRKNTSTLLCRTIGVGGSEKPTPCVNSGSGYPNTDSAYKNHNPKYVRL